MKNETKQTAVEWFSEKVLSYKHSTNINGTDYIMIPINKVEHLKDQAKEMEKEQMIDFALECQEMFKHQILEKFNETYGGNK